MIRKLKEWDLWQKVLAGTFVAIIIYSFPEIFDSEKTYRNFLIIFFREFRVVISFTGLVCWIYLVHKKNKYLEENIAKLTDDLNNSRELLSVAEAQVTGIKSENQHLVDKMQIFEQKPTLTTGISNTDAEKETKIIDASHARLQLLTQQLVNQEGRIAGCTDTMQKIEIGHSISRLEANIGKEKKGLETFLSALEKK